MKKTYKRPEIGVTTVELQGMIATSIIYGGAYDGKGIESRRRKQTFDEFELEDISALKNELEEDEDEL